MRPTVTPTTALLLLCSVAASARAAEPAPPPFDHSQWEAVLQATVKAGKVDYAAVRDRYAPQLDAYLDKVADTDADALPRDEQLALYVNLYNASMMKAVAARYTPWYSVTDKHFAIFTEPLVRVSHKTISLDDLEHGILRARFKDPRVHAALVCAGLSCPPLWDHAYTGPAIDAQLDRTMRDWLANPAHNRVDPARKHLTLSKIFLWYAADFGGPDKLAAFAGKYLDRDLTGYTVSFFQYDFRLNDLSPDGRP